MRILSAGPLLYGLLYPVLFLARVFRVSNHGALIASGGQFVQKTAEAELVVFDAAPGLDSEAGCRHHEAQRKKSNTGAQMGNFSFFSGGMADHLMGFAGHQRPDLVIYPPLRVIGPLTAARYDMPIVVQTIGFGHTSWHIRGVTRPLTDTYRHHNVGATPRDMAWIDVTPPGMSILESDGEPVIPMQYVPYNDDAVWEPQWGRRPNHRRFLVSLGIVKPMVDGLDLVVWVMDSASEVDAETVLHISTNARSDLHSLPSNVRLVDWIPVGVFLNGADGLVHCSGAGNTLTALHVGISQIIFDQGADHPANARVVAEHGYGIIPGDISLSSNMIDTFLSDRSLREVSEEVTAEVAA